MPVEFLAEAETAAFGRFDGAVSREDRDRVFFLDDAQYGVLMAGGGSLLRAFPDRVAAETQLPVHVAASPLTCVAVGSGRSLEELDTLASAGADRGRR